MEEVRRFFLPEFINRIDDIILFNPLTEEDMQRIVDIQLREISSLLEARNIKLQASKKRRRRWPKPGLTRTTRSRLAAGDSTTLGKSAFKMLLNNETGGGDIINLRDDGEPIVARVH